MDDRERSRKVAVGRMKAKRDFRMHLGTYVIINAFLVGIWALSGRADFRPIWVMGSWGIGFAFHGWWAYFGQPFTEKDKDHAYIPIGERIGWGGQPSGRI